MAPAACQVSTTHVPGPNAWAAEITLHSASRLGRIWCGISGRMKWLTLGRDAQRGSAGAAALCWRCLGEATQTLQGPPSPPAPPLLSGCWGLPALAAALQQVSIALGVASYDSTVGADACLLHAKGAIKCQFGPCPLHGCGVAHMRLPSSQRKIRTEPCLTAWAGWPPASPGPLWTAAARWELQSLAAALAPPAASAAQVHCLHRM